MAQAGRIDIWLKRSVLVLCACFMVVSCIFVWRLATVLDRIEDTLSDIQQITGTAARISEQLGDLVNRMEQLERRTGEVLAREDIGHLLDELVELSGAQGDETARLDASVDREINALLARIAGPGLRFEYGGRNRSAAWVAVRLHAKYRLYRKTVTSAEDFIENVASTTMTGDRYYVVHADGTKQDLDTWLLGALREYRSRAAEEDKATAQNGPPEPQAPSETGK